MPDERVPAGAGCDRCQGGRILVVGREKSWEEPCPHCYQPPMPDEPDAALVSASEQATCLRCDAPIGWSDAVGHVEVILDDGSVHEGGYCRPCTDRDARQWIARKLARTAREEGARDAHHLSGE